MDDRVLPIARLWKTHSTKVPYGSGYRLEGQRLIDCKQCQFQPSGDAQLIKDVAEMVLYRVFADFKVFRNLFVGITGNYGRYDF